MNQPLQPAVPSPAGDNPFFANWSDAFGVPPFGRIAAAHFEPAFTRAFAEHEAEVDAIAGDATPPSFDNTIGALERSGKALSRVSDVFHALTAAHTDEALLALEREMSPRLAKHWNTIRLNEALFRRIDALYGRRGQLGLSAEQARVLERYYVTFRRSGAAL
jgi:peptidyl-dipeptidase Dcp